MTSTWKVDPFVSTLPDAVSGDFSSVNTNIIRDERGAFFASQLGFTRSGYPSYMVLPSPGVDIPFINFQSSYPNHQIRARASLISIINSRASGPSLGLLTQAVDDTPRYIASSGSPKENAIVNFQKRERWKWTLANERNAFSQNPALIPGTVFSTLSCDVLSEIQRHMLEPTIDGGLTWSTLWEKEKIQRYFSERLSRFFLETGVIQEEFSVATTAGNAQYNYPEDLIWTKRLTFEEPLSLYTSLRSFWRLNEPSGTRVDSIGSNDLTPINGVGQAVGKILYAANLIASSSQSLRILDATQVGLDPGTEDFSISIWFYPTTTTGFTISSLVTKGAQAPTGLNANGYDIGITSATATNAQVIFTNFGCNNIIGYVNGWTTQWTVNAWNHYVFTGDRDGFGKGYLNGEPLTPLSGFGEDMSRLGNTQGDCNSTLNFTLSGTSLYTGRIDAVGFWNRVLTRAEVEILYNNGNGRELFENAQDGDFTVLPRVDPFTLDNGFPGWQNETGVPSSITEEPQAPLSFTLCPTPDVDGSVEGIYVPDPSPIGDTCTPLPIPNFLCWIIKYGVMADMLGQEGEANDPQRQEYCERRWSEGIQLTRALLGWGSADQEGEQ